MDNVNSAESIYKFLLAQQDTSKKLLNIAFKTSESYDEYITNYLAAIENINDDKYDMLTNKSSEFLFYNFFSTIGDDNYALTELQNRNWPYFIEKILAFSQNGFKLTNDSITDKSKNEIIKDNSKF